MPHIRLECSRAVADHIDAPAVFEAFHRVMVEEIGADRRFCKSRLYVIEDLYLADGAGSGELAALEVFLIAGRAATAKAAAGDKLMQVLRQSLAGLITETQVHLSVRLVDMPAADYFMAIAGPEAA